MVDVIPTSDTGQIAVYICNDLCIHLHRVQVGLHLSVNSVDRQTQVVQRKQRAAGIDAAHIVDACTHIRQHVHIQASGLHVQPQGREHET